MSRPVCPKCGGRVAYDLACHTYGGTDADGETRWWSCISCDSAVEYLCTEWLDDDRPTACSWRYTHGLSQGNPRAVDNESRRPPWIPEGLDLRDDPDWRAPGVPLLGES